MKTAKFFVFLFGMVGNIWLIKKLIQVWKKKKAVASGCRKNINQFILHCSCQISLIT